MNLFAMMETSGGAMQAERMRAEVVAANMANAETTRTAAGGPYRRQHVVFAARPNPPGFADSFAAAGTESGTSTTAASLNTALGSGGAGISGGGMAPASSVAPGVQIAAVVEDGGAPLKRYDPGHPDAGADGYVAYPDINPLTEMVDLMGATRAYGLNSSAVQAEKGMISSALEIAKA
ncbi:MAG: flagellar basal body rod protein FlgC [Terracidiphilus sp.]